MRTTLAARAAIALLLGTALAVTGAVAPVFAATTRNVTGHVYLGTAATSAGAGEVRVTVTDSLTSVSTQGLTDASGNFSIAVTTPNPTANVRVLFTYLGSSGFTGVVYPNFPVGLNSYSQTIPVTAADRTAVDVTLLPLSTVTGHVDVANPAIASAGSGQVGVTWTRQGNNAGDASTTSSTTAWTDASGNFTIPNLESGYYTFQYTSSSGTYEPTSNLIPFTSIIGGPVVLPTQLMLPKNSISGRVQLTGPSGTRYATAGEVKVTWRSSTNGGATVTAGTSTALTDATGAFVIAGLSSANVSYRLDYEYLGSGSYSSLLPPYFTEDVRLTPDDTSDYKSVTMQERSSLSGRVLLGNASTAAAAGRVKVEVYRPGIVAPPIATVFTNSTGGYVVSGLGFGNTYNLVFTDTAAEFATLEQSVVMSTTAATAVPDVILTTGLGISGSVFDSTGSTLAGVDVRVVALERYGPDLGGFVTEFPLTTDSVGHYAVGNLDKDFFYYVEFSKAGYAYQSWPDSGEFYAPGLIVLDSGAVSDIDVTMYHSASIGGTLTAAQPVAAAALTSGLVTAEILVENGLTHLWEETGYYEPVAANGAYVMTDLSPDTYRVRYEYESGGIIHVLAISPNIVVAEGQNKVSNTKAVAPRDMSGDGKADILGRNGIGLLYRWTGTGSGGVNPQIDNLGSGWNGMNLLFQAGDFDRDGNSDMFARDTSGNLWLFPGRPNGTWGTFKKIGTGWNGFTAVISPGDFNGDGNPDALGTGGDGKLYLYKGDGLGGWSGYSVIGTGWNGFTALIAPGDFDGDGNVDMMGRDSIGRLYLYKGDGRGGWLGYEIIGSGWNGFNAILGAGDFDGDGDNDVFGRDYSGKLWLYKGTGHGGWEGGGPISTGWGTVTFTI